MYFSFVFSKFTNENNEKNVITNEQFENTNVNMKIPANSGKILGESGESRRIPISFFLIFFFSLKYIKKL